ncbi:MAG: DUF563 domain-containing protein, partial [Rhodobacteraceae bacterium]|nr:DUF563 domain-containing protein [Paracoccaceae bacterium]
DTVLLRWHGPVLTFARGILACGSGSRDLDRVLLEVLPRAILAAQEAPAGTPLLTEADLPLQALQALRLALPDHPLLQLPRGQAARVDQLYAARMANRLEQPLADPVPGARPPAAALRLHPGSLELLRAQICPRVRPASALQTAARLFLCADQLSHRRLLNAEEMAAGLARCGFLRCDPALAGLAELVALVQGATEIVATDCPQLAVLALARPGTRVWVLHGNAPGTDFHRWDVLGRLAGLQMVAVAGWQVPGSAGLKGRPVDAHYSVPPDLVLPAFDTRYPQDRQASALLDRLHSASSEADVLTGAWAVLAEATPAGFEARLRHLRLRAAEAIAEAPEAALEGLLAHPFLTDFGRSLRSGFPVLGGFSGREAAIAAQVRRVFAGSGSGSGSGLDGGGPLPAAAFAGAAGARRLTLLGMLLVPGWQVPLPALSAGLPEDVVARRLDWAMAPPALIRAGEDAAWVGHVERLLHWLADGLEAEGLPAGLRLRLRRMAGRLDLGQLLLVDEPLRGVQTARNRVLGLVALGGGEAGAEAGPAARDGRLREALAFTRERLRLVYAAHQRRLAPFLRAVALRGVQAARNRVLGLVALGGGEAGAEAGPAARDGRLRVGVLCRTFEKGPDSEAVLAFFRGFDPSRYALFAYSIGFRDRVVSRDPAFDRLFDATFAQRRDLPADPAGIRARLLADGLDVFLYANATTYGLQPLDLALFHRIAPLQLVMNSHVPMPMGYPAFDALLTGRSDDPAREPPQTDYAERLVRLPGPVINYLTPLQPRPNPPLDRAALGLAPDDVVLMNAGSSMKLRHACLKAMMQAVADVPRGVLLLAPYNPGWAARSMAFAFNRQLADTAAETGLDPARIRVLGELSVAEAEAALACADLYLNPFPHGGATMTHLALLYGVPPVTLRRASTRSIDQFLIESHGFAELLADTPEDYITLARSLATDAGRRSILRRRLRSAAQNPGFIKNDTYAKNMQNAVQNIWDSRDTEP